MPVPTNAAQLAAALIAELRVKGDYRLQLDETISPVAVVARLDGGAASQWPRNLSTDWRGAALTLNINTNPAIWYRFNGNAGSNRSARITRLRLAMNTSSSGWVAVFRGDLQATLGGGPAARFVGQWVDNTGPQGDTGPQTTSFGLQQMTATAAPLNFAGNPLAIIRQIGAQRDHVLDVGIDCGSDEILSIVPLNTTRPAGDDTFRFEALVSTYALGIDWLEEF